MDDDIRLRSLSLLPLPSLLEVGGLTFIGSEPPDFPADGEVAADLRVDMLGFPELPDAPWCFGDEVPWCLGLAPDGMGTGMALCFGELVE